jgi:hypothetical protein
MELQKWFEEKDYGIGLAILGGYCKNRVLLQNLGRKPNQEKLEYELTKIAKEQGIIFGTVEETTSEPPAEMLPPVEETGDKQQVAFGNEDKMEEKLEQLEEGADAIVGEKLSDMEMDADNIIDEKLIDLDKRAEEILAGKLNIIREGKKVKFEELPENMKKLVKENYDSYKETRALHEKLKLMVNATPADRQPLTERLASLDDKIRANWEVIDAWQPGAEPAPKTVEAIDHKRINANRKFISTNLKKLAEGNIVDKKIAEVKSQLQLRYNELKSAGEEVAAETLTELAKAGIEC